MVKTNKVCVTLKTNTMVAQEVAFDTYNRANPHDSQLVENKLQAAGITVDELTKYFEQLSLVVCDFWQSNWDLTHRSTLAPHEIRGLYLPLVYSVIFASVGNIKCGNFEFVLTIDDARVKSIDKNWLIDFSARLETVRNYILGGTGQIGNRNALPQTSVMMAILAEINGHEAEILIKDGSSYDAALSGFAALMGLSLVEEANKILYTGVETVNFRRLIGTVKESKQRDETPSTE